jgi:hypothetical protein
MIIINTEILNYKYIEYGITNIDNEIINTAILNYNIEIINNIN